MTRRAFRIRRRRRAQRIASEQQRFILFNRRWCESKVEIATFVFKIRLDGERQPEIVRENFLRCALAHVHAHRRAPALLKPPTLLYVHLGRHLDPKIILRGRFHLHRSNHPREHDFRDRRVELARKSIRREQRPERRVPSRRHQRPNHPRRHVTHPYRVSSFHLQETQRDELVVRYLSVSARR